MKILFFIAFSVFCLNTKAQIMLEFEHDSASNVVGSTSSNQHGVNQLMIINFEVSGYRYVHINRSGKYITIYDLNHSLLKKIDCSGYPLQYGTALGEIIYLSEQLFNLDSKVELMYGFIDQSTTPQTFLTLIYDEDGNLLFSDSCAPLIKSNVPLQQYPIYNTPQGTKMILSYPNGHAKVFSLPGTLSASIDQANHQLMQMQNGRFGNLYPNPSPGTVTIEYELPKGEAEGEIVLYNMQGLEVKRYGVDNTFKDIYLDNSMLPAGTYLWQLQTRKGAVGSKKMVVVK